MASKYVSEQRAYEDLANAIIAQAVDDYKMAYQAYLETPYDIFVKARVTELRIFFDSEWYGALTTVDAKFLIETVEKECKEKHAIKMKILNKRKEKHSWK